MCIFMPMCYLSEAISALQWAKSLTDPDFASNVSLLVSMSEIVVLVQDAAKIFWVSCVQNQQDQNYVTRVVKIVRFF